eukprot:m.1151 g.1151  ORF g.1151 m.1151 type:complete len:106 (+) comp5775_c0_seq2:15-332(+)
MDDRILRKDWLGLQARWLPRWKRRCAVLTQVKLAFYLDDPTVKGSAKIDCTFQLNDVTAVRCSEDTVLELSLHKTSRKVFIDCYTDERTEDWSKDISYHALKKDK